MKVYIGADHRGFELKEKLKQWLEGWGYEYEDMGNVKYDKNDDYPDFAGKVGERVGEGEAGGDRGVVICGSGVGMNFVTGKFKGVRSMIGINPEQVEHGVEFDQANVLSLAADHFKDEEVKEMVKVFLKTKYGKEERFLRRSDKIKQIEVNNFK